MSYTRDEMETICRYDYLNNEWIVETNVQKHITKLQKIAGEPIQSEIEGNRLISGRWVLSKPQIRFSKVIERKADTSQDS